MMSFFLLGHGDDDQLHLLSTALFATRQDAMAELTSLTADPSFAKWDSEVFVVDFETAMPVLLVRPAAASVEPVAPSEGAFAQTVDVEAFESASDVMPGEELGESAAVFEAPVEPLVEPVGEAPMPEPVGDAAIADEIAASAEETAAQAEPADDLRDALLRTTAHMESTGIVAPESVGPAEVAEPATAEPATAEPATAEPATAEPATAAPAAAAAPVAAAEPAVEGEAPAWPWDITLPAEDGEAPAQAAPADDVAPFVLDALEEPSMDDANILPAPAEEAGFEVSRPVILGAYDEPDAESEISVPAEPASVGAPAEPMSVVEEIGVAEPMSVPETFPPASSGAAADLVSSLQHVESPSAEPVADITPDAISDFIFDLGGVTTLPEAEQAQEAGASEAVWTAPVAEAAAAAPVVDAAPPVELLGTAEPEYTCDDCVYVETCPSKGQRLPKDCVSFQWK